MPYYIGCDLGGTNIKAGLVDLDAGRVLSSGTIPTHSQEGPQKVIERMAGLLSGLAGDLEGSGRVPAGVGVSAPGYLDPDLGTTIFLPNLAGQWRNIPLAEELSQALGLPVTLLNDARAITYGEYRYGAGKGSSRLACYAIGTGVGGGLILDGKLLLGFQGTAGEVGHQTIEVDGPRCSCGNNGCLEVFASGPAITRMALKAIQGDAKSVISALSRNDPEQITPELVARAAEAGDRTALEIWAAVGRYLGTGIANTCVTYGPEKVVICGGVAAAGDLLLDPIRQTLRERIFVMPVEKIEVLQGTLGIDAGILGMASWAADRQSAS